MPQTRNSLLATAFFAMSIFTLNTDMAYAAVRVSDTQIAEMANACNGGPTSPACIAAVEKLITELQAANPDVGVDTIIESIASGVSQVSTSAIANIATTTFNVNAAVAAVAALSNYAAQNNYGTLASSLNAVALDVSTRYESALSGNGSPG